jgi:hypothetical protein
MSFALGVMMAMIHRVVALVRVVVLVQVVLARVRVVQVLVQV